MKILTNDCKRVLTESTETILLQIDKKEFLKAIFEVMSEEMFIKIQLLKRSPYFNQMTAYSLYKLASMISLEKLKEGRED